MFVRTDSLNHCRAHGGAAEMDTDRQSLTGW